jgi:DNA-binding transcriptional ArsR family regulator
MSAKQKKNANLEVSSDQLRSELIEIKERVGALETIASISNKAVVEKYVRESIVNDKARQILKECEVPRTREHLMSKFSFKSPQAVDHHLGPLREADLLRQHFDDDGKQTFEWSNLFKRLPKKVLKEVLGTI